MKKLGLFLAAAFLAASLYACQTSGGESSKSGGEPEAISSAAEESSSQASVSDMAEVTVFDDLSFPTKDLSQVPVELDDQYMGETLRSRYPDGVPEEMADAVRESARMRMEELYGSQSGAEEYGKLPPVRSGCLYLSVYDVAEDESALCFALTYVFEVESEDQVDYWMAGSTQRCADELYLVQNLTTRIDKVDGQWESFDFWGTGIASIENTASRAELLRQGK